MRDEILRTRLLVMLIGIVGAAATLFVPGGQPGPQASTLREH